MISWCICIAITLCYMLLSFLYMIDGDTLGAGIMLLAAICFKIIAWVEFARDLEN